MLEVLCPWLRIISVGEIRIYRFLIHFTNKIEMHFSDLAPTSLTAIDSFLSLKNFNWIGANVPPTVTSLQGASDNLVEWHIDFGSEAEDSIPFYLSSLAH